ncbi:sushi, von Willebrand factor type A, EGF and pentraxin domain-containing protein 1-like [Dendronephthya gigantea]|uniref:sushi, von Willebrand factor type A, EGF and pentraxin domain-containing protein 1-like n=1 Tax=Dendronephthya gigantea TaxID=151771 RepID=UPI00106C28EE|nr:sushi, von Willebrand factor type A, EGF and pentraxin domain-containing protein 1-like [Dendronephthya gigantea]
MALFATLVTESCLRSNYRITSDKNKALQGHCDIFNTTTANIGKCLQLCLGNCSCKSFQLCHLYDGKTECQLCSSDKHSHPAAMTDNENCSTYNFEIEAGISENHCEAGCTSRINCCLISTPCYNGGTCVPHSTLRFTCKCPLHYRGDRCEILDCAPGYAGENCEREIKSCKDVATSSGILPLSRIYTILDSFLKTFEVFCDFENDSQSVLWSWTLVQSYAFYENGKFRWASFLREDPPIINEKNWHLFRLGKTRMESLRKESTKWRVTCCYDTTDGVDYRDYVRASFSEVDPLVFDGEECVRVDHISVRGQQCKNCTAYAFQKNAMFHFRAFNSQCEFKTTGYKQCLNERKSHKTIESNFGFYSCANEEHSCSAHMNATTQTWFGAVHNSSLTIPGS